MEECLINLNKGEGGEGCLKFNNILNGVQLCKENYWKVVIESTVCYDSISVKIQWQRPKLLYTLAGDPQNIWGSMI
jgi:hypothetical protein